MLYPSGTMKFFCQVTMINQLKEVGTRAAAFLQVKSTTLP